LRRIGCVLYYYHRVVETLTALGELPAGFWHPVRG